MKKSIIIKAVLCLICVFLTICLLNLYIELRVQYDLSLVTTYLASHDIAPRTKIKKEDVVEVRISKEYVLDHMLTDLDDIVGKYTDIQGMIPAGSPFYETMLYDGEKLGDYALTLLRKGQACFSLETTVAKLGSIVKGQRIDIHITIQQRQETPMTGILIQNARVLMIKDHQGIDITDQKSEGIPYLIELAVDKEDLGLLQMAKAVGELELFASSDSYAQTEAQLVEDSNVVLYIQQLMQTNETEES